MEFSCHQFNYLHLRFSYCDMPKYLQRRKHELGGKQADSVQATPCWWFIWHTKICSLGSTFKTPSRTVTHSLFLSVFSLQQYNYAHCRPQEHSLCREGTAQYRVVSPAAHVIKRWKSTDARRDRDLLLKHLFTNVTCLCTFFVVRKTVQRRKGILEVSYIAAGRDLGHSQDFIMGSSCSLTHDAKISIQPATTKLNRQKQTVF